MPTFRSRELVDAVQVFPENFDEIEELTGFQVVYCDKNLKVVKFVDWINEVPFGAWAVYDRPVSYILSDEEFEKKYEEVKDVSK